MAQGRRHHADHAFDRSVGPARRILVLLGRKLADTRSGVVLLNCGNSLDYPIETIDSLEPDRIVASDPFGRLNQLSYRNKAPQNR